MWFLFIVYFLRQSLRYQLFNGGDSKQCMIEMADDIRIVKISYKNLQDIASKCEETDTRHDGEGEEDRPVLN